MRGWTEKNLRWYLQAGQWSQYPDGVLAKIIPRLRPHHTVLDIGCGPGLYALAIAPLVKQVLALDCSGMVLQTLGELAWKRNLPNIRCLEATWPQAEIPKPVDIVISAFSGPRVMNRRESLSKIMNLGAEIIYLVAPGQYRPPFAWPHHRETHTDADATLALLEEMGLAPAKQELLMDFGQPVMDWLEAGEFLSDFLRIPRDQALEHAKLIGKPHTQGIYLPNPRNIVLICIERERLPEIPCT